MDKKLPTQKECLEKAYQLAVDIEQATLGLPKEIIFYPAGIKELIEFCQGVYNVRYESPE